MQQYIEERDAALSGLRAMRPQTDERTLRLGAGVEAACRVAADKMTAAMEASDGFAVSCEGTQVRMAAGLARTPEEEARFEQLRSARDRAVGEYSDAHLGAHRLQYAAEYGLYASADRAVLTPLTAFRYDRDLVDGVIADMAQAKWLETHPRVAGKNCLLVGTSAPKASLEQLIASNTHSPIPLEGVISANVRTPYGEPTYEALQPGKLENNDLRPVHEAPALQEAPERTAQREPQAERTQEPTRIVRTYDDSAEPNPARKRTTLVADLLWKERKEKGIRLSPDPAAKRTAERTVERSGS